MSMKPNGLPRAICATLTAGAMERADLYAAATAVAGNRQTAQEAISRLQSAGLVTCEVRLTPEGLRALGLQGPTL
jgi:ABC-type branched-subunit amino acid transport system substrate-binding protein